MRRVGLTRIRSILLLFLVSVIAYSPVTIYVNAQTTSGLVCVSRVSYSCPIVQPVYTGRPGTQLSVNVVVQGAEPFDAYSVVIGVNSSILQPVGVNATGGLLPNINSMICTGGQGDPCAYWLGLGPGDVRVAGWGSVTNTTGVDFTVSSSGSISNQSVTTGLLFTITYEVRAETKGTQIVLFDQVSPSGWSCACALFSNSVKGESFQSNVQGGWFSNSSLLLGDANGDCRVEFLDLVLILYAWGSAPGSVNWNPSADLNGDGKVDLIDFYAAVMNYGSVC